MQIPTTFQMLCLTHLILRSAVQTWFPPHKYCVLSLHNLIPCLLTQILKMVACFLSKLSRLFSKEAINSENVRPPFFIIYLDKTLSTILNSTFPQKTVVSVQSISILQTNLYSVISPETGDPESCKTKTTHLCSEVWSLLEKNTNATSGTDTLQERVDLLNKSFIEMMWYFVTYESYKQNMWSIFSKHSVQI